MVGRGDGGRGLRAYNVEATRLVHLPDSVLAWPVIPWYRSVPAGLPAWVAKESSNSSSSSLDSLLFLETGHLRDALMANLLKPCSSGSGDIGFEEGSLLFA